MPQGHPADSCASCWPTGPPGCPCAKLLSDQLAPALTAVWGDFPVSSSAFVFTEHVSLFLQPVRIPLNDLPLISHSSQLGVICKLAESVFCAIIQLQEDAKLCQSLQRCLRSTASNGSPAGHQVCDHCALSLVVWQVIHSPCGLPVQSASHFLVTKMLPGTRVER